MSVIDNLKEQERVRQEYIQNRINSAKKYIEDQCKWDPDFQKNVEALDLYDFSEFLSDGRSLINLCDAIEEKYDKEFWDKYHLYVWDSLSYDDACVYFEGRYNVWFQEYTDWVVRHDNGTDEKTRRRVEDSPGKMEE